MMQKQFACNFQFFSNLERIGILIFGLLLPNFMMLGVENARRCFRHRLRFSP